MKISIVTPSYNQAQYLEETLCSVLDQNYSELEYIVMDGGSTDESVEILKKYSRHLTFWTSEKDRGQSHAINKGLERATGEVWSYLNSDDLLVPGSLQRVAEEFARPEVSWVGGVSTMFDGKGERGCIAPVPVKTHKGYLTPWNRKDSYIFPCSNVSFMRRSVMKACGLFDERYHYSMDIEYYVRAIFKGGFALHCIPDVMGKWRWHEESKTMRDGMAYRFREEEVRIASAYLNYLQPAERAEVATEIEHQEKWLLVRKALYARQENERLARFRQLVGGLRGHPSLLWFRPWLGAMRQVLFTS